MNKKFLIDMSNLAHRVYHSMAAEKGFKVRTTHLVKTSPDGSYEITGKGNNITIHNTKTNNTSYLFGKIVNGEIQPDIEETESKLIKGTENLNKLPTLSMNVSESYPYKVFVDDNKEFFIIRTDDKKKSLFHIKSDGEVETMNYQSLSFKSIMLDIGIDIEVSEVDYNDTTKDKLKKLFKDIKVEEMYVNFDLLVHNLINSILRDAKRFNFKKEEVVACFDGKSWRKQFLEDLYQKYDIEQNKDSEDIQANDTIQGLEYKAQRIKNYGNVIYDMLDKALVILPKLNISALKKEDYEADDLIAILSMNNSGDAVYNTLDKAHSNASTHIEHTDTLILSNDGDFPQLLQNEGVRIFDPRLKNSNGKYGNFVNLEETKKFELLSTYLKKEFTAQILTDIKVDYNNVEELFEEQNDVIKNNFHNRFEDLKTQLPELLLLLKIYSGDVSDNISSVVPELFYNNEPINIQYGEITILKNIAKIIGENNMSFDFEQVSDLLQADLFEKLYKKIYDIVKKDLKTDIAILKKEKKEAKATKVETVEAINALILTKMSEQKLGREEIMKKIKFLIYRNNVMINFQMVPEELVTDFLSEFQEYEENKQIYSNDESRQFLIENKLNRIAQNYFFENYRNNNKS